MGGIAQCIGNSQACLYACASAIRHGGSQLSISCRCLLHCRHYQQPELVAVCARQCHAGNSPGHPTHVRPCKRLYNLVWIKVVAMNTSDSAMSARLIGKVQEHGAHTVDMLWVYCSLPGVFERVLKGGVPTDGFGLTIYMNIYNTIFW